MTRVSRYRAPNLNSVVQDLFAPWCWMECLIMGLFFLKCRTGKGARELGGDLLLFRWDRGVQ